MGFSEVIGLVLLLLFVIAIAGTGVTFIMFGFLKLMEYLMDRFD